MDVRVLLYFFLTYILYMNFGRKSNFLFHVLILNFVVLILNFVVLCYQGPCFWRRKNREKYQTYPHKKFFCIFLKIFSETY